MQIIIAIVGVSLVIVAPILLWRYRHDNINRVSKAEDSER